MRLVMSGGGLDFADLGLALGRPKALATTHAGELPNLARKVEHGDAMESVSTAGAVHDFLDSDFAVFSLVLPAFLATFLALGSGFFSAMGSPKTRRESK